MTDDIVFMRRAIELARFAAELDEIPVGCVITRGGVIISEAYNTRETDKNAVAHAELTAIERACAFCGGWRLHGCTLYVTLEPCPMCAGAAVNARLDRVVFGASDPKAGAFASVINLNSYPLNHKPNVTKGVLGDECAALLSEYFMKKRKKS